MVIDIQQSPMRYVRWDAREEKGIFSGGNMRGAVELVEREHQDMYTRRFCPEERSLTTCFLSKLVSLAHSFANNETAKSSYGLYLGKE